MLSVNKSVLNRLCVLYWRGGSVFGPRNISLQHIEAKGVVIIHRHPLYDRTETDIIHAREHETGSHIATNLLTLTLPYWLVWLEIQYCG